MTAKVTLKQGKSYRYGKHTFEAGKTAYFSDPSEIADLQKIGVLLVEVMAEESAPTAEMPSEKTAPAKPAAKAPFNKGQFKKATETVEDKAE